MKKIFVIALLGLIIGHSGAFGQSLENPKGEVRLNFFNTIMIGTAELGYEMFFDQDQSLGIEIHLNDRFGYASSKGDRDFNATSFLVSYNFYFAGDDNGKLYISPLLKYRIGEFRESVDGATAVTNLNSLFIGIIGGYKWNFNNFAFGPFAGVARGFADESANRFSRVEFKAGLNVGYRF